MYIHLGQSTVVRDKDIIGIFDTDNTTVMKSTREYLNRAEKNGEITAVSYELPKSFVVCSGAANKKRIFLTQVSTSTLFKRTKSSFGE